MGTGCAPSSPGTEGDGEQTSQRSLMRTSAGGQSAADGALVARRRRRVPSTPEELLNHVRRGPSLLPAARECLAYEMPTNDPCRGWCAGLCLPGNTDCA